MADAEKKAKRTDTVRAARSEVVKLAREVVASKKEGGDTLGLIDDLDMALDTLDERLAASKPAKAVE